MNILEEWEITPEQLTKLLAENPSLRGMLFGYVAELKLREIVTSIPGVSFSVKFGIASHVSGQNQVACRFPALNAPGNGGIFRKELGLSGFHSEIISRFGIFVNLAARFFELPQRTAAKGVVRRS